LCWHVSNYWKMSPSAYIAKSFAESIVDLGGGTLRTLLTLTLVLFVVLIPFAGFGEPQRIMGEGKLKQMFFYPRSQSHSIRGAA